MRVLDESQWLVWRRRSRALSVALFFCTIGGCGFWKPSVRGPRENAPDLLEVSSLTPKSPPPAQVSQKPVGNVSSNRTQDNDKAVTKVELPMAIPSTPTIPVSGEPYIIDLTSSILLADAQNPTLAEARVAILAALAVQQQARALLFPSLNAGMNYHGHDGDQQRSSGRIIRVSEQSFYIGGGAQTVGTQTVNIPAVNIWTPLTDAIFEPLAAQQRVAGARFNAGATANSVLLDVTQLFFELLGAEAQLESRRVSARQAEQIAKTVNDYAVTGQGRKADADRARTELGLLRGDVQHAEELVAVASARLSNRLNLDPSVRLQTLTGPLEALNIMDPDQPIQLLIRTAIERRPDLAARAALVSQAEIRLQEEKTRPLLPTLWLGFSGGAFGGGSNISPPLLAHFGGRTDTDVRVTWTLLNFGAGNASIIKRRRAEVGESLAERSRIINRIRAEVTSARAETIVQRRNVEIARAELASSEAGFREDFDRLRETLGLPIEVIDSLKLLAQARVRLIEAITRFNQAQFALFVALGSPPPIDPAATALTPPPPIATPLHSPIVMPKPEPMPYVQASAPPVLGK